MLLNTQQLTFAYANQDALFQNINFSISADQKIALIGNNGAGKSTLLQILNGTITDFEGQLLIHEKPYFVPQLFGQYNDLTVAEALQVDKKIIAYQKILEGDPDLNLYEDLQDD